MNPLIILGIILAAFIIFSSILTIVYSSRSSGIKKAIDQKDLKGLIKFLGYRKDRENRDSIIRAIAEFGDMSIDLLINALNSKNHSIRVDVVETLGKIGSNRAFTPLIMTLYDPSRLVRIETVKVLAHFGSEAVELIASALKDYDPEVRRIAKESLQKLNQNKYREGGLPPVLDNQEKKKRKPEKKQTGVGKTKQAKHNKRVAKLKTGEKLEFKNFKETIEFIFDDALEHLPVLTEEQLFKSYERVFSDWRPNELIGTKESVRKTILKNGKSLELLSECRGYLISFCSKKMGYANEEHILLLGDFTDTTDTLYILARIYRVMGEGKEAIVSFGRFK